MLKTSGVKTMENKYRAYFFSNMYLQGVHAGVQSAHTLAEMFNKYQPTDQSSGAYQIDEDTSLFYMLETWSTEDKTIIVLNGGMAGDLQNIINTLSDEDNPYPWAYFKEDSYSLNGALTNVGIILPEKLYNYDKNYSETLSNLNNNGVCLAVNIIPPKLTTFETKIVELLRGKRLAN